MAQDDQLCPQCPEMPSEEIHTSGGEIFGILQKDEMSADLADSQGKDASKANHAPLDAAKKQAIATVTIQTNLRQGQADDAALVAAKRKEEVATLTGTIETNLQYGEQQGVVGVGGGSYH